MKDLLVVYRRCVMCQSMNEIPNVPKEGYIRWEQGEGLIQDCLPDLSADDRELLISGTCPQCWEKLFGNPFSEEGEEDES